MVVDAGRTAVLEVLASLVAGGTARSCETPSWHSPVALFASTGVPYLHSPSCCVLERYWMSTYSVLSHLLTKQAPQFHISCSSYVAQHSALAAVGSHPRGWDEALSIPPLYRTESHKKSKKEKKKKKHKKQKKKKEKEHRKEADASSASPDR